MTTLAVATLQRLTRKGKPAKNKPAKVEPDGAPLSVQFNPSTLRITRNNNVDHGGLTATTQKVQSPSVERSTLTFDLEFDTAEQTAAGHPVDVRSWTAVIRQFVEPPKDTTGPPPAVQFAWGTLVFNGVVEQVTEDLDYFDPDGTPLHAKVSVTISEQNFAYEAKAGPAQRNDKKATQPGEQATGTELGARGTDSPDRIVAASAGESAQQLLSRLGLDPAGWRGAMQGLDSPLALPAGSSISLGPEVRTGGSLGVSSQFAAGGTVSDLAALAGALGKPDGASAVASPDPRSTASPGGHTVASGFALAAAGGPAAADRTVQAAKISQASTAARSAFEVPGAHAAALGSAQAPGSSQALGSAQASGSALKSNSVPDARSLTYGTGVPLQTRAYPTTLAEAAASGRPSLAARARPDEVPTAGPATPPWVTPPVDPARARADDEQRYRDAGPSTLRWKRGGECR